MWTKRLLTGGFGRRGAGGLCRDGGSLHGGKLESRSAVLDHLGVVGDFSGALLEERLSNRLVGEAVGEAGWQSFTSGVDIGAVEFGDGCVGGEVRESDQHIAIAIRRRDGDGSEDDVVGRRRGSDLGVRSGFCLLRSGGGFGGLTGEGEREAGEEDEDDGEQTERVILSFHGYVGLKALFPSTERYRFKALLSPKICIPHRFFPDITTCFIAVNLMVPLKNLEQLKAIGQEIPRVFRQFSSVETPGQFSNVFL